MRRRPYKEVEVYLFTELEVRNPEPIVFTPKKAGKTETRVFDVQVEN
jgi:hypothetical protein